VTISVPTVELVEDLASVPEGVEVVLWPMTGPPPRDRLDIVVPPYIGMYEALPWLDGVDVGLVQAQSIGFDGVEGLLPPGVAFANATSVHEASTAELAIGLTIAAQRGIDRAALDTRDGVWHQHFAPSLADRRVLLLGYGGVGKAVAARLAAFEVDLAVVASRARVEAGVVVHGIDELPSLLPTAEIVILTLPGGRATRHIVDDAFMSALPERALLVNVGRGSLIDTDALVEHVRRGGIRAALDVTEPEPLPAGHPLWGASDVLITPHLGGTTTAMRPRVKALLERQIRHFLSGEDPENVVIGDPKKCAVELHV